MAIYGQNPVHGRLLLCRLAKLRDNSRLCDVTLVVEGTRINAHRVVLAAATDYFEAMFTNDMAESHSETIELKDVEASALEALINFCYYGRIRISSTNVWSVLPAACLLQLNEVKEQCSEFLEKRLGASNCLKIRAFADTYACDGLLRCAHEYILHNFKVFEAVVEWVRRGVKVAVFDNFLYAVGGYDGNMHLKSTE
ncbi:BTB/POZ domain protein, partial [Teladorsagia circumcincta]